MNADTIRQVNQIKTQGYWRKSQTLGEGGWSEVRKFADGWNEYILWIDENEDFVKITARDDEAAIKAFAGLYRLDEYPHEIYRVKTEYTKIK